MRTYQVYRCNVSPELFNRHPKKECLYYTMHKQTLWDHLRYEFLTCSTPITRPTGSMLTWVQCRAAPCLWTSIGQKPAGQWQMLQC